MSKYKILISFGKPEMGKTLLRMTNFLVKNKNGNSIISALHLSPNGLFNKFKVDDYEKESFYPLISESKKLNLKVEKIFKTSEDIQEDIVEIANKGEYDLLLVGIGQSIFKGSLLGNLFGYSTRLFNPDFLNEKISGKEKFFSSSPFAESTMHILAKSKGPVGILIDNNLQNISKIFLPFLGNNDSFLIEYARKFISNSGIQITIFDAVGTIKTNAGMKESLRVIEQYAPNNIEILDKEMIEVDFLKQFNLILISLDSWSKLVDSKSNWLKNIPSVLILRH